MEEQLDLIDYIKKKELEETTNDLVFTKTVKVDWLLKPVICKALKEIFAFNNKSETTRVNNFILRLQYISSKVADQYVISVTKKAIKCYDGRKWLVTVTAPTDDEHLVNAKVITKMKRCLICGEYVLEDAFTEHEKICASCWEYLPNNVKRELKKNPEKPIALLLEHNEYNEHNEQDKEE